MIAFLYLGIPQKKLKKKKCSKAVNPLSGLVFVTNSPKISSVTNQITRQMHIGQRILVQVYIEYGHLLE